MAEPLLGKPPRRGSRLPWRRPGGVLALVCTFTAFLTFKPSEPYLVVFLNCVRSVPHSTIVNSIFPAWTYAQLALLPLLATASELIGYRFVVLCGMAGRNATLLILIFGGSSVALLTLSQVSGPCTPRHATQLLSRSLALLTMTTHPAGSPSGHNCCRICCSSGAGRHPLPLIAI